MVWKPGHQLQEGKYIIEKTLGEGGFGITYLAKDDRDNRFAIKTLKQKGLKYREFVKYQQDFLNEAKCLAQCTHPSIVRVQEVIHEQSLPCIIMEYIDGIDLASLVEHKGPLPELEAIFYIHQIGEALNLVHEQGFLHRDVKPLNIVVRKGRSDAVLVDFGFALEFTQNQVDIHREYGSRGFAPIEQYDLRSLRGAYTDVYGLAATLYALLTAEVPASSTSRDRSLVKEGIDPLVPPQQLNSSISDRINAAILKGLAFAPENRSQTVEEWLKLLAYGQQNNASLPPEPIAVEETPTGWSSAVGMDYSKLRDLLAEGKWQEADRETEAIMLRVCDREKEGRLNSEDLKNFPCRDLRTIDKLWVEASKGHFGWSVQNRIWRSLEKNYEAFGDRIGWRKGKTWLPYSDLTFELRAPEGHLPSWGRRGRFWPFLASTIKSCSL